MSREKALGLFGRFEPLHLPLSSSRRPMQVLGSIIQISALLVLHAGKQLTLGDAVAPQLVGHDYPRHILETLQRSLEKPFRSVRIAPRLNEVLEHNAVLIDGAPEIVRYTPDPDKHLVEMPFVAWPWPAAAQAIGETRSEFLAPPSHFLVEDDDATFGQNQLNTPQAKAEHVIKPDGMTDDLSGEPMTIVRI